MLHVDYYREHGTIEDILLEANAKITPESQMVKYFDILDGFCMAIHEYVLGNEDFLSPIQNYCSLFETIRN
jgi:hypothetical protein